MVQNLALYFLSSFLSALLTCHFYFHWSELGRLFIALFLAYIKMRGVVILGDLCFKNGPKLSSYY